MAKAAAILRFVLATILNTADLVWQPSGTSAWDALASAQASVYRASTASMAPSRLVIVLKPLPGRRTFASESTESSVAINRASGAQAAGQPGGLPSAKPAPYPSSAVPLDTAQIAELATPSVVIVENYNEDGQKQSQGSGYIFAIDGVVVTNYHVVRGASSLVIKVPGAGDP